MDCSSAPRWLQGAILSPPVCVAGTPRASILLPRVGSCYGSMGGGLQDASGGCSGACGPASPGFYSRLFLVEVTGWLASRHQSVGSIWLRHADEVQDGDHSVCVGVYQEGGLDVLDRLQRHMLPDSCPSGTLGSSFCLDWHVFQFCPLCFGLSMAP